MAKTEEEVINLKLEGVNYKIKTKIGSQEGNKIRNLDQSELFEKQFQIYLTEEQKELTKVLKFETEHSNVNEFKKVLSRIEVETDRPDLHQKAQSS
jgi:hypothetical protein